MAKLLFLLLIIVASVKSQCNTERTKQFFKRSIYDFSVKLSARISLDTEGHFIASGLSPWLLLSTVSLGATAETLSEIAHVLRLHPHSCFNNKFNKIARKWTSNENGTILERSAAIIADSNLELEPDFSIDVLNAGVCNIEVLSFNEAAATAAYINDLVSKATHEAIDEIVTSSDIEGASLIMIDAVFFKGAWKIQFPYYDTESSAFYNEKGEQTGDVNLMYVNDVFNVTSVKQLRAKVLELPYGEENRFSMLIFLPFRDATINNVLDNLSLISLRTIFALFERRQPETVAVQIPRFKLSSDINNLKELLMDMGLKRMFDRSGAQFEDLASSDNVFVSNLIQKAELEVTEDGTVASVVSEAVFQSRMLPEQFVANKPFVFMIVDRDAEIPLFIGAYSLPNVF